MAGGRRPTPATAVTGTSSGRARVPRRLLGALFALVAVLVVLHVWFAVVRRRPVLTGPAVALVGLLVAIPLVPYAKRIGVGSFDVSFRRSSRDLQDELVRVAGTLVGRDGPSTGASTAALRNVESDPDGALDAAVSLVYHALYDLATVVEAEAGPDPDRPGTLAELPDPSGDECPSREALGAALDRVTAADPPEFETIAEVLRRFLDALVAARDADGVETGQARELVELAAHLVTYLRLYGRLYKEVRDDG